MAHDFGRILQALQVMHQFDDALGGSRIERLRREGDAVAEFRFEQIPSHRVRWIAGNAVRRRAQDAAVPGADFDRRAGQGGLPADRQDRIGVGPVSDPVRHRQYRRVAQALLGVVAQV